MKIRACLAAAIITTFAAAGASAAYLEESLYGEVSYLRSAMNADEGVPQNMVTAMKADEGVPQNLITAMRADEGVPQDMVTIA
jgi:hypothetical protein